MSYRSNAREKGSLDAATAEYQSFKLSKARQEAAAGAPDRLVQARERIASARTRRELDAVFAASARALRR